MGAPRRILALVVLVGCATDPAGLREAPDRDLYRESALRNERLEPAPLAGWVYPFDRLEPEIRARRGNFVLPGDTVPIDLGDLQCAAFGRGGEIRRLVIWKRRRHVQDGATAPTPGAVDIGLVHPVYLLAGSVVFVREDGQQWVRDLAPGKLDAILWKHFERIPAELGTRVIDQGALRKVLRELEMPEAAIDALPAGE